MDGKRACCNQIEFLPTSNDLSHLCPNKTSYYGRPLLWSQFQVSLDSAVNVNINMGLVSLLRAGATLVVATSMEAFAQNLLQDMN